MHGFTSVPSRPPRGISGGGSRAQGDVTVETVRRWIRTWRPEGKQQVHVHRSWGTVAAMSDGKHPVEVVRTDGGTWVARALAGRQRAEWASAP